MNTPGMRARIGMMVIGLLGFWSIAEGKVVYVAKAGSDANDGLSWATAKVTVQAGLNSAVAGDEVWVAAGTYVERITLTAEVALYGGFTGSETELAQRNWKTNLTTLDGDAGGSVVTAPKGATLATRVDGFTIRNGRAFSGGGVYCDSSSPTISNNTITGNVGKYYYGGGIYCESSSCTITNNTITGNTALSGGGIFCVSSSPTIADNVISGNSASGSMNEDAFGGGIYCYWKSAAMIRNNTIDGNRVGYYGTQATGGGICCDRSNPVIIDNTISNNQAVGNSISGFYGGGIACINGAAPAILNDQILRNSAGFGGGIYSYSKGTATIANSVIAENSATEAGGGMHIGWSSPMLANSTIVANNAPLGGGLYWHSSTSPITNTIIAFNSSGVCAYQSAPAFRACCVYGNLDYNYSGLSDPTGTDGNISVDPKLADMPYGNVHLRPDSPCIDAGDDAAVQTGWMDIDGQTRIAGAHVDIGADESDGTAWPQGPFVIVRVGPEGNDANDGSSWNLAKKTVQAAIDAASTLGGEVWMKAGTYPESITLKPCAHVYGGFVGSETSREQRNWHTHISRLTGQPRTAVVKASRFGRFVSTLDGFDIHGNGTLYGTGISCTHASPTIANNTVVGNTGTVGGGISCDSCWSTIVNNVIAGNSASSGGGISCYAGSPFIINNTITGNAARYSGGISTSSSAGPAGSSPVIVNNIIAFNSSGLSSTNNSSPIVRYNCVYGNGGYDYSGLADPTGSDGNISIDPRLANVPYGNMHLQPGSPCVDAGDDSVVQLDWRDVDCQARIAGAHVDIGADESDGTIWPEGPAAIVLVSPDGEDANDGLSWESAKKTVQAAIDVAALQGGDVWVREGLYPERITLRQYVYVYGGFGGTETDRRQRDWRTHTSTLDGQFGGSVVTSTQPGFVLITLDGFTIRNGNAANGGGISCQLSSPLLANNTVTANTASDDGGGIYCYDASPVISNSKIMANTASDDGGGVYCHFGVPVITNSVIANNSSSSGGGVLFDYTSGIIAGCTIVANRASSGGGLYLYDTQSCMITNTIVAFNSSGVDALADETSFRACCVYGNTGYDYSGVTDPTGTDGNLSADPRFVRTPSAGTDGQWATADDDLGDLHLKAGSPCIDAGDNAAVPAGILTDLDGLLRFIDDPATPDTGLGTAPIVDMGAYEYVPGDYDRDGEIDADDMAVFAACVSGPAIPYTGDCAGADFDRDGDVDQSDFGFIQRWYSGAAK